MGSIQLLSYCFFVFQVCNDFNRESYGRIIKAYELLGSSKMHWYVLFVIWYTLLKSNISEKFHMMKIFDMSDRLWWSIMRYHPELKIGCYFIKKRLNMQNTIIFLISVRWISCKCILLPLYTTRLGTRFMVMLFYLNSYQQYVILDQIQYNKNLVA